MPIPTKFLLSPVLTAKKKSKKRHVKGGLLRMVTKEAAPYPSRTRGGILSYAI